MIAASTSHCVAIKVDGTVWSWGSNNYGQLGIGTVVDSDVAVRVPGVYNPIMVAVGASHTLVLKDDGTVWSCGYNAYGQLGIGTSGEGSDRSSLVQVKDASGTGYLDGIVKIACGGQHCLALRSDGTLWAWGNDYYGQLGLGQSGIFAQINPLPRQVGVQAGWTACSASSFTSMGLMSGGAALAWGGNNWGQLGIGNTDDKNVPTPISGLASGISQIYAGPYMGLAIRSDGILLSWGMNDKGQLGTGNLSQSTVPVQVLNLTNVTAAAIGYRFMLASDANGDVWSCGANTSGVIGINNTDTTYYTMIPLRVHGEFDVGYLERIMLLDMGFDTAGNAIAIRSDGAVFGWGHNGSTTTLLGGEKNTDYFYPFRLDIDLGSIAITPIDQRVLGGGGKEEDVWIVGHLQ